MGDEIKIDNYEGTVKEIQTRATIITTYDERRAVIPNADLFTHSVIVNTALDVRRWEYDFAVSGISDLNAMKARIVNAVRKVPGILSDPGPEALILDLRDPDATGLKLRILWWTKAPRQHEMLTSYDAVLTAIWQTLSRSDGRRGSAGNRAA